MNRETRRLVDELPEVGGMQILEISGRRWQNYLFGSYQSVHFPEFDVCNEVLEDNFDLIIAEQVFEHLPYPYRAGRNVHAMLKSGGRLLITTPCLVRLHPHPYDCTRWTPVGMRFFLEECGFPQAQVRSWGWGNRECLVGNLEKWAEYRAVLHSLENDPALPLTVWAIAQK